MTRIFVYEYLCAQRADDTDSSARSLRAEGEAMRNVVVEDLRAAGAHVITMSPEDYQRDEGIAFRRMAATANQTLVIAPEFHHLLEERCRWVKQAGGHLLGPSAESVRLTADKLTLGQYLAAAGVPTPRCWDAPEEAKSRPYPQVWKPRFGAGSVATRKIASAEDRDHVLRMLESEGSPGEMIGQEWAEGHSVGVSFLVGPVECVALPPAWQVHSTDGTFKYLGGRLPIPSTYAHRAINVARRAVRSVPGLLGYVGVDVVLGERDWVIEINPRLTTSYVGLRALSETNLAQAMLTVATGGPIPELTWRRSTVRFGTQGQVRVD